MASPAAPAMPAALGRAAALIDCSGVGEISMPDGGGGGDGGEFGLVVPADGASAGAGACHWRRAPHDHDDELLVAVAVVLVAADEVVRAGPGEGEHRVAVGERVDRRVRVAGVVRALVDEQHRVVAGLVRERCMQLEV